MNIYTRTKKKSIARMQAACALSDLLSDYLVLVEYDKKGGNYYDPSVSLILEKWGYPDYNWVDYLTCLLHRKLKSYLNPIEFRKLPIRSSLYWVP